MLKDTIISAFNYDGTLLKWLKKVQEALENASASEFRVNKKGNATISFSIVFANGDTLESGDIVLQQGESVTGATIRQGHLILTLSNGDELDAGDVGAVTGFSINSSQHLIVTYQNGTTQDLGAIFTGNVNINGNLAVTGNISDLSKIVDTQGRKRFIEGEIVLLNTVPEGVSLKYGKWSLSGTHLMLVFAFDTEDTTSIPNGTAMALCRNIPQWIINKIVPLFSIAVDSQTVEARGDDWTTQSFNYFLQKATDGLRINSGSNYSSSGLKHIRINVDLLIDTD